MIHVHAPSLAVMNSGNTGIHQMFNCSFV